MVPLKENRRGNAGFAPQKLFSKEADHFQQLAIKTSIFLPPLIGDWSPHLHIWASWEMPSFVISMEEWEDHEEDHLFWARWRLGIQERAHQVLFPHMTRSFHLGCLWILEKTGLIQTLKLSWLSCPKMQLVGILPASKVCHTFVPVPSALCQQASCCNGGPVILWASWDMYYGVRSSVWCSINLGLGCKYYTLLHSFVHENIKSLC